MPPRRDEGHLDRGRPSRLGGRQRLGRGVAADAGKVAAAASHRSPVSDRPHPFPSPERGGELILIAGEQGASLPCSPNPLHPTSPAKARHSRVVLAGIHGFALMRPASQMRAAWWVPASRTRGRRALPPLVSFRWVAFPKESRPAIARGDFC
jgi:hypothetical protein